MEKNTVENRIVIITGPESTGKSELAQALAVHYHADCVPELAREYVEKLNRQYTYADVECIAKLQLKQFEDSKLSQKLCFFDTGLIITKVWFDVVFNKCPAWLVEAIKVHGNVNYLLCDIDLPWVDDPVRENGGEKRKELFQIYKKELQQFGFSYEIISGVGYTRTQNAIKALGEVNLL